jgi:hypothetical protein
MLEPCLLTRLLFFALFVAVLAADYILFSVRNQFIFLFQRVDKPSRRIARCPLDIFSLYAILFIVYIPLLHKESNMVEKKEVNKSQAIRDYLKEHPDTGSKDVADALTKQGIEVSPNFVAIIKDHDGGWQGEMETSR